MTDKRWQLPPVARSVILDCILQQNLIMYELEAVVVMPDHVHMIVSPSRDCDGDNYSLPQIMRKLKGVSAHLINKVLNRKGSVWQSEFFDHVVRHDESLEEKIDYILMNPVRAGLVSRPHDYKWSWRKDAGEAARATLSKGVFSMTAGYSGTPLPKKLGLDGRKNFLFVAAPSSVLRELGFRRAPRTSSSTSLDFGLVFTKSQAELKEKFHELVPRLDPAATLWISWPKKTSGVATDLNENIVRDIGLAAGLVDVKVCAIDDTWSGLKFVFRLKDRAQRAKRGAKP